MELGGRVRFLIRKLQIASPSINRFLRHETRGSAGVASTTLLDINQQNMRASKGTESGKLAGMPGIPWVEATADMETRETIGFCWDIQYLQKGNPEQQGRL